MILLEKGEVVLSPKYDSIGDFEKGVVEVRLNGKDGYIAIIDKTE